MVQVALCLAQAATGRTRFVPFDGHCHRWPDNILVSIERRVASAGQPAEALASTTVLPPFPS